MPSESTKRPPAVPLPADAMLALQNACKPPSNQAAVARKLGVSGTTISTALKGRYIGNVERLAERIRGELLNYSVACPILGEITARICQDEREKPFSSASSQRVRLYRACQQCPNNPKAAPR